jgi:hypothetical protein
MCAKVSFFVPFCSISSVSFSLVTIGMRCLHRVSSLGIWPVALSPRALCSGAPGARGRCEVASSQAMVSFTLSFFVFPASILGCLSTFCTG